METQFPQGKRLYEANCANCHMNDGTGLNQLIPSLVKSAEILSNQNRLPCLIRSGEGLKNNGERTLPMPTFPQLTDIEINNIVNYLRMAWDHEASAISLNEIQEALKKCTSQ